MDIRAAFRDQAKSCAALGSPFTARLLNLSADRLSSGGAVADRILGWEGNVSSSGQSVPLRLAGALHGVKRAGDERLAGVYPPHQVSEDALWGAVEATLRLQEPALMQWLDSPPQTNEVRRSVALIPAMHMVVARFGLPVNLYELGCSAGLNLRLDHFHLAAGDTRYGPQSGVELAPDWSGPAPTPVEVKVASRQGVDLRPIDPATSAERLYAYLWADQPKRLTLTQAAIDIAAKHPAQISAGDASAWLAEKLRLQDGTIQVVFHTVAWQYFPEATQAAAAATFADVGAQATPDAPLARISMEADGGRGAELTLQVWPGGENMTLGRVDFHGRWIDWNTACLE